jgi:hypothetical protein
MRNNVAIVYLTYLKKPGNQEPARPTLDCVSDGTNRQFAAFCQKQKPFDQGPAGEIMPLIETQPEKRLNRCLLLVERNIPRRTAMLELDGCQDRFIGIHLEVKRSIVGTFEVEQFVDFLKVGLCDFRSSPSGQDQPVLVADIKLMEGVQPVFPVRIWFESLNGGNDLWSGKLYLSAVNGALKPLLSLGDGKQDRFGVRDFVPNESINHDVQCGPEIVNSVADNEGKSFWDGFICMDRQLKFRQVWILGEHEPEWALSEVGIDLSAQVVDMMLGPLDF